MREQEAVFWRPPAVFCSRTGCSGEDFLAGRRLLAVGPIVAAVAAVGCDLRSAFDRVSFYLRCYQTERAPRNRHRPRPLERAAWAQADHDAALSHPGGRRFEPG